jgi:hypothetical protein
MNYLAMQDMNDFRTLTFKTMLLKLEPVDGPRCDRYKQASATASNFLCDCDPLAELGYRGVTHHFTKSCDFADFSASKVLHFVQSAGLLSV